MLSVAWFTLSSSCFREEKKDVLDAVIGVLGVLVGLRGGGVTVPGAVAGSGFKAATLAAVGVLSGRRFNGGKRSG